MELVNRMESVLGVSQRVWTVQPPAPGGTPLLFLHGARGSGKNFSYLLKTLGKSHPVFAPDLPGFGASPPLPGRRHLKQYPEALVQWLDVLGLERAIVVGSSMGGAAAIGMALERPDRVSRLILMDSIGVWLPDVPVDNPYTLSREERLRRTFYDPERMVRLLGEASEPADDEFLRELVGPAGYPDYQHRLQELGMPTLILWGEADGVTPLAYAHRLATGIANARLEIIARSGHLPFLEQPEAVRQQIERFLAS